MRSRGQSRTRATAHTHTFLSLRDNLFVRPYHSSNEVISWYKPTEPAASHEAPCVRPQYCDITTPVWLVVVGLRNPLIPNGFIANTSSWVYLVQCREMVRLLVSVPTVPPPSRVRPNWLSQRQRKTFLKPAQPPPSMTPNGPPQFRT